MSLIETLRTAIDDIPPSHLPANAVDAVGLLGSVIAYLEHGAEKFVSAVESGNVADLYKSAEQLDQEATEAKSLDEANAEIAALRQQLANQQAVAQRTQVGEVTQPGAAA